MSLLGGGSNTINIGINATDNASGVIGNVGKSLDGLNARGTGAGGGMLGGLGNTAALAGIAAGVGMVGAAAYDLGSAAARVEALAQSFESLSAKAGMSGAELKAAMQDASAGTISEADLMLGANKALMLGVADNADELVAILSVAKSRGQALGLDVTQSFDNLVTGIGRGSAEILDNLGITPQQIAEANEAYAASLGITAEEMDNTAKKAALLSVVMQEASAMGAIPETSLASYQRLNAEMENFKTNMGDLVQPVTGGGTELAASVLGGINDGLDYLQRDTFEIENRLAEVSAYMQGAQLRFEQNKQLIAAGQGSPAIMQAYIESLEVLNGLTREQAALEQILATGTWRDSAGVWADVGAAAQAAAAQEALAARQAQELATAQATAPTDIAAQQAAYTTALEARAAAAEAASARIVAAEKLASEARAAAVSALPVAEAVTDVGGALGGSLRASGSEGGKAIVQAIASELEAGSETVAASGTTSATAFSAAFTAGIAAQKAGMTGSGGQSGRAWLSGFLSEVQAGISGQLIAILTNALVGPVAAAISSNNGRTRAE